MSSNVLVTGFGPFERVKENPSESLAKGCGLPNSVVEVSYDGTRRFLDRLDPRSFETLLLLGAHGNATRFHIEILAHNRISAKADVSGFVPNPSRVRDEMPQ